MSGCGPCGQRAIAIIGEPIYDPTHSYNAGDFVVVAGVLYKSLHNDNEGNNPQESPDWWTRTTILDELEIPETDGVFFRQVGATSMTISDADLHYVPFADSSVPPGWWKVGRRLSFEIPIKGVLYSETTFGVRLLDEDEETETVLGALTLPAGTEIESFRLVCDVAEVDGTSIMLKCWLEFPFSIGLPSPIFSEVIFDTNSNTLAVKASVQQATADESVLYFQNAQFAGLVQPRPLVG
jgi:hypothetical protein